MSSISSSKTIAVSLLLIMLATAAVSQFKCYYGVGQYRNCTCGIQYRILEKRCCSSEECQQPVLTTENFTCPFVCQNGGTYDAERKLCHCPESHHGLCCEQGTVCIILCISVSPHLHAMIVLTFFIDQTV